jgi:hypothetical protein
MRPAVMKRLLTPGLRKPILVLGISRFVSQLKNSMCVNSSVHEFRECVINGNCDNFPNEFQPLAAAVNTLIISTVECERSFSNMNTTISCVRSSMLLKTAAALMFISLVGHPISEFNPNYVEEWQKKRSSPCRLHFLPSPCRKVTQNIQ